MLQLRVFYTLSLFFATTPFLAAQCPVTVSAGDDIYLCAPPTPTQLNGEIFGDYLNFNWTPTTGMSGGNTLSPTVTVSQTTRYVLTANAPDYSNNLVENGDFESGNTGFTSDYTYSPGNLVPEGLYDVLDNPQNSHPGFAPCDDHTSGSGNMMVVNGAGTPNLNVWCQTVTVTPNTQYVLSAWVTSVVAASPALLQFSINGTPVGGIFSAPGGTCNWQQYFQTWNSGSNGSATICIVNQNTTLGGNDFALDDIVFSPVCSATDTVTVHVINVSAIASPPVYTLPCEGATVQLSGNGSSTGPNIVYEWTTNNGNIVSGENTLTPIVDAPGEYVLTVSYEVNGQVICSRSTIVNVILNPNTLTAWVTPPQPLGCGSPTTLLLGNSSQPAFSVYEWSTNDGNIVSGADQKNATVNQVGTYTLTVTNSLTGCTATTDVSVILTNNVPTSNATSNGIITCANDSVPLFGTGSSNGPNISYAWTSIGGQITGPTDSLNTTAGAGGTYILSVTNTGNNCTSRDTVVVPANVTPPSVVGTLPPQLSCDPDQDTISIFIIVGPPAFVLIHWTTNDGNIVSGQFTPAPQADQPGLYTVSVFDPANGCYNFDTSMVIANFTVPMADVLPPDTVTCLSPSIVLEGGGSSVGANFSIQWTSSNGGNIVSGANTLTPTVNAAGDYLLILRDSVSLCADTALVSVVADTNVVVAIANAPDTLSCAVQSVTLNTNGSSNSGNLSYLWTTQDGNITSGQNTPNPTVNAAGTYQLLLTNTANGCNATDLAVVGQNTTPPPISINPPDTLTCAIPSIGISAQINGTGSFQYLWTASNGGNIVSGDSTLNPTVNQAGTYTLTATNLLNGCSAAAAVNVVLEAGLPTVAIAAPGPLNCVTDSTVLNSSGSSNGLNFSYLWSTSDGNITQGADSPSPTVNAPGTYVLLITNTTNGCTASAAAVVAQDTLAPAAAILTGPDTLNCLSNTLELIGDGTGIGQWSTSSGNILFSSGFVAQIDAPGVYVLTVTNPANGCSTTDAVEISENTQAPTLSIATPAILSCVTTDVPLNASASGQNLNLDWQTLNGNIVSGQNTAGPTVNAPGDYTLLVTDAANGCTNSATISVAQDTAHPILAIAAPATITCDVPTLSVAGQNLSLPGNFSYNWSATAGANIVSGGNTLSAVVDAGGTLTLTAINLDNGCETLLSVNVDQNTTPPIANAGMNDTLSCLTNALSIQGSGSGAPNLSFSWQSSAGGNIVSGGNTPTPMVDQPGTYTLTVENPANGCTATSSVQIFNDLNAPNANAGTAATLNCALTQTTLNATASTGANISYNWTASGGGNIVSGQNTLSPTLNAPGVYTLFVTDAANGCVATSSITVQQDITPPLVDAGATATLSCAVTSLSLSGNSSGGAASYVWSTTNGNILSGGNSLSPTVNQPGQYTLTATLASNGCSASDEVTVAVDTLAPGFQITPPAALSCTALTALLTATVQQPGTGNFTAQWTSSDGNLVSGQNTLSATADQPGTYLLVVQNTLNGCLSQQTVLLTQNITPPDAVAAAGGNITCSTQSVGLNGNGSSAGSGFAYQWTADAGGTILSGQNSLTPTVGSPGTYTLLVSNAANGCTATVSTTVGTDTIRPIVVIALPQTLSCIQNTVTLNGSASSQGPQYSVSWATSGGNIVSGQGTFSIVVNQAGNYLLAVVNENNGCEGSALMLVQANINTPGALIIPTAPLHCNRQEVILLGSSPTVGALTYSWTSASGGHIVSGDGTPTPLIDAPGSYTMLVTNPANGCSSATTIDIGRIPDPVFEPSLIQPNCKTTTGGLSFGPVAGGTPPFRYALDGGLNFGNESSFLGLMPGNYHLVLSDDNGCTSAETVTIDEPFLPTIALEDLLRVERGDSVQLSPVTNIPASQIAYWEWSPAADLSCSDCAEPWAMPLSGRYYTVTVSDLNGCTATDRVLVQVFRQRRVYPPNVFSPNDDGENDRFTLYAKGVLEIRRLVIFDRWGEEMFERRNFQPNDESLGWDGSFRGKPMNPGVYVWAAEIVFTDGEVEVMYGDVTVVR